MKKINLLAMLALVSGFLFTACEDDPEPNNLVTIEGIPATAEIENLGTVGPVNATITAEDGLASVSVTKDGETFLEPEFEANATSLSLEFSYTAEEADADQNIVFEFTATDTDGDTETFTHVLSVGEAEFFPNEVLSGLIEENLTLTNDRIWELAGRVIVTAGNTLTIEPGTIIKGRPGDAAAASVLIIARDADIQANGTAEAPIVFTSSGDEIGVGEFESSLDLTTQRGLWGGVLILGNAPISAEAPEAQIEGIPVTVTEGLYGGDNAEDNSGVFEYVSIRYTGAELGPGNELQGLTLGGVGSGTTINHVESINSSDDGMEVFGGTVNISNFIVWACDDDGYDTDQGWSGTIDNFVYIGADQANGYGWDGDHAMELDGSEGDDGSTNLVGKFINGSLRGLSSSDYADLRDGAKYDIQNTYFFDFPAGSDIEIDAGDDDNDPRGSDNYANDITKFIGLEFNTTNVIGDIFVDQLDPAAAAAANDRTEAEFAAQITESNNNFISNNSVVSEPTVGADVSVLLWSYTAAQGQLDSF
jgi:hypothetical protein